MRTAEETAFYERAMAGRRRYAGIVTERGFSLPALPTTTERKRYLPLHQRVIADLLPDALTIAETALKNAQFDLAMLPAQIRWYSPETPLDMAIKAIDGLPDEAVEQETAVSGWVTAAEPRVLNLHAGLVRSPIELVRTIGHELVHAKHHQTYGRWRSDADREDNEREARAYEDHCLRLTFTRPFIESQRNSR